MSVRMSTAKEKKRTEKNHTRTHTHTRTHAHTQAKTHKDQRIQTQTHAQTHHTGAKRQTLKSLLDTVDARAAMLAFSAPDNMPRPISLTRFGVTRGMGGGSNVPLSLSILT